MQRLIEASSAREVFHDDPDHIAKLSTVTGVITRLLIAQPTGEDVDRDSGEYLLKVGLDVEAPEPLHDYMPHARRHLRIVRDEEPVQETTAESFAELIPFPRTSNE